MPAMAPGIFTLRGARRILARLNYFVPQLQAILPDSPERDKDFVDWCMAVRDEDLASCRPYVCYAWIRVLSLASSRFLPAPLSPLLPHT
jgi:hypothetical protein